MLDHTRIHLADRTSFWRAVARRALSGGAALLVGASLLLSAAVAGAAPGNSHAFGKSLADWQAVYFNWYLGATSIDPDANDNAAVGKVVLMPLPDTPGDGTPGQLDVTLQSGQPFVLPLWVLLGNSYADDTADDLIDLAVFETLDITLQVDGKTVITSANVMDYYSQFDFDPAIPLDDPFVTAFVWYQGIGMVHGPLSVGEHTITLDVKNTDTEHLFGWTIEYHNTWNITVAAGK